MACKIFSPHTNGFSQSIWSTSLFFHVFSSHLKCLAKVVLYIYIYILYIYIGWHASVFQVYFMSSRWHKKFSFYID